MSTFRRMLTLLGVVLTAALAAMITMTMRRAGPVLGFHWPWAWFVWVKAYGRLHPLLYLGDLTWGVGVFVLPIWITVFILKVTRPKARVAVFGADVWAKKSDLQVDPQTDQKTVLIHKGGDFSGRIFGRFKGKLLVYKGDDPVLVIGATRSGKGAGNVVPTLIAWPDSAFIYARKSELWDISADRRKTFSHCVKFDPTDPHTVRWNPLFEVRAGIREVADVQNYVTTLVDPAGQKGGKLSFWDESAVNFFTSLILHVLYTAPDDKKHMAEVRRRLADIGPTLHEMLNTTHRYRPDMFADDGFARDGNGEKIPEAHPEIVHGATAFSNMEDRVKGSVVATMAASMRVWADPLVEYATSTSDITIGDLVASKYPVSFYLQSSQAHADRLAVLVCVFMRQTINSLHEHEHYDGRGRRKNHRLLMMLDEFPKLGTLRFLESALGEMTGYGLVGHLVCQSFDDIYGKYGTHTSIFTNCRITSVGAVADPRSAKEVVDRVGKSRELRESYSDQKGGLGFKGTRSVSQSEHQQYVLTEDDVRQLDPRKQFIFINGVKPLLADKIQYWNERVIAPHCGQHFKEIPAKYQQRRGSFDLPGTPQIDWLGVCAVVAAPPPPASASAVTQYVQQLKQAAEEAGEYLPPQYETGPSDVSDIDVSATAHGEDLEF